MGLGRLVTGLASEGARARGLGLLWMTGTLDMLDELTECSDHEEGCVGGIVLPCNTVGGGGGGGQGGTVGKW